jgi:hypothetical protein
VLCADQRCHLIVDCADTVDRFVLGLVAADLALANRMVDNGVDDPLWHE